MNRTNRPKLHNPFWLVTDGSRERYEEVTDGFRFETFRNFDSIPNHSARLRRALDANEPHICQAVTNGHKIHYFDFYKDAMAFLLQNGYIPKPEPLLRNPSRCVILCE